MNDSGSKDTRPFVTPGPPPPPAPSPHAAAPPPPVPYGSPDFPPGWIPAYGAPVAGGQDHKGATSSFTLGIIAAASLVLGLFCCLTLPGVLCAPVAWVMGARARTAIDAAPQLYGNRWAAQAGYILGLVVTLLGATLILVFAGLIIFVSTSDYTLA